MRAPQAPRGAIILSAMASARARVSARSRMGEKLAYFANHWEGLTVFLDDGRVEKD